MKVFDFYKKYGRMADVRELFQLWAVDRRVLRVDDPTLPTIDYIQDKRMEGKAIRDSWEVHGERGTEWTEMIEVANHFNYEADGCFYFVGAKLSRAVLLPSYEEVKSICKFVNKFDCMALKLVFG